MHGFIVLDGIPPAELLERGRQQVRHYGGRGVFGEVTSAEPAAPGGGGDLRLALTLADGRTLTARRALVATELRDALPDVPGLAEHWCAAWCTARTATAGRCATSPSAPSPPAPHRSTMRCCCAN
ncbi:hypothetical protein [Streptomyces sp. NBC_01445]|uniref:hypothetical protein n=1 Tax=Streptomyces sp. NBC_01445 TaxID=2903869 RepID=UPI003FA383E5